MDSETSSRPRLYGVRFAVDVGQARVGLAACDAAGILATPVETLHRDKRRRRDQRIIINSVAEREAIRVYVGHPVNLSGESTVSTQDAVEYARQLSYKLYREGLSCEVRLIDERLSTVTAHRQLRDSGRSSRTHRDVVDQVAAVQILQHALDMEVSQGPEVGRVIEPHPAERGPKDHDG